MKQSALNATESGSILQCSIKHFKLNLALVIKSKSLFCSSQLNWLYNIKIETASAKL